MIILRLMALHDLRHPSQLSLGDLIDVRSAVQLLFLASLASSVSSCDVVYPFTLSPSRPFLHLIWWKSMIWMSPRQWWTSSTSPFLSPPKDVASSVGWQHDIAGRLLEATPHGQQLRHHQSDDTDYDTVSSAVGLSLGAPSVGSTLAVTLERKLATLLGFHGVSCRRSEMTLSPCFNEYHNARGIV